MKKRLFLLDAYALIFRGYYAFIKNPRINSKGLNTSAIMGFLNSVFDVIKRENPDYIAVAFDKGGSHQRSEMFSEYKANRDETPEAIRIALPYIHQILNALQIAVVEKEGYEADDIIGTLAKQAEQKGYTVFMVTPDKDYGQLVSENIFMYRPPRSGKDYEVWGVEQVKEKFGVQTPEQVIDFLGMMGDAVDNIPGLPGVGEKTAKKLLEEFGSMENLFANTDKLKGKLRENIEANQNQGILSKELARIILNVPVTFDEETFVFSKPKMEELIPLFEELEFRTLLNSVQKIYQVEISKTENSFNENLQEMSLFDSVTTQRKTINDVPHIYQSVTTLMGFQLLVNQLLRQKEVCFDTETTSLNELDAELIGIAFSWEKNKGYYAVFPEGKKETQKLLEILRPFFESEKIIKIGQNLKYDIKILSNYGISVKGKRFDTMLAHYLLNPEGRHSMDILAENYLNYVPISIENLIGKKGKNQISMRFVPLEEQKEYAVEDADITFQLKTIFAEKLKQNKLESLFEEVEIPLMEVLASMEKEGIRVDVDFLKNLSEELRKDLQQLEQIIYNQAGESFNLASPKQLGDILFEKMKLSNKPQKTKTGQYATSEAILSDLVKEHPIIANVLEFRQLQKLQNTYIDALPTEVHLKTGRVHTSFMQTVTATGRLSSNNPNLQNIPVRTERGQQIRKAFIPKNEEYILLSADYSQIELRVIASLSNEKNMIEAFLQNQDIHKATASKVFNVSLNEVTKEQRSHAKTVNFGIIYGVSAMGLSNQTELSRSESKQMIEAYYQTYPMLKLFIDKQVEFARENGYVETILGRRRFLPDIHSRNQVVRGAAERNAVNTPVQGSAADIIKLAMIQIFQEFRVKNMKSKMLLQVHDELIFDIYKPELEQAQQIIKEKMQNAYALQVPLVVDIGIGNNWLEAH